MKARFLALLAAVAVGSAAVLIYASQTQGDSSASLSGAEDCSSCEMSAMKPAVAASLKASDECCAADAAKPAVATLDAGGCPYDASATTAALVANVQPAKATGDACCPTEAAGTTVSAQIEK